MAASHHAHRGAAHIISVFDGAHHSGCVITQGVMADHLCEGMEKYQCCSLTTTDLYKTCDTNTLI